MKNLWRKTQVRPPKVRFGRRTCMRFGGTLGPRKHELGKFRFGRRKSSSAAEHCMDAEAHSAPERGLASHYKRVP